MFGVSAGANAIGSLLVADHGKAVQHLKLFRAAIMESGATSGYVAPYCALSKPVLMNYGDPAMEPQPRRI